ncbi:hypothetical protein, partial [Pantoea sp. Cy-639]|uniref:hypothetical protein n=1 Tax=Pantoea sp. Cy-639 TaxID=2608360 RepID=UPI0014213CEF
RDAFGVLAQQLQVDQAVADFLQPVVDGSGGGAEVFAEEGVQGATAIWISRSVSAGTAGAAVIRYSLP